ncbi:outer membrane protein [Phreatobacter oligotrophus]|uniref:outer membrane protein n=1 Tax=Phreatobacter oligotrophus TaxID=1122261 RepID=UPI003B59383A|nr:outer membrane beta-barrel protein [Phreatobacter oligotrophus]
MSLRLRSSTWTLGVLILACFYPTCGRASDGTWIGIGVGPTSTVWRRAIFGTSPPEHKRQWNTAVSASAGYDFNLRSIWLGPTIGLTYYDGPNFPEYNSSNASRWTLQAGVRVGLDLSGVQFAFLSAGLSARHSQSNGFSFPDLTPIVLRSKWSVGYYLGAGAGWRLSESVSAVLEYRFTDHGGHRQRDFGLLQPVTFVSPFSHQLTVGLTVHYR